jgi:D-alanyl-D-alanine carboxypeptidase
LRWTTYGFAVIATVLVIGIDDADARARRKHAPARDSYSPPYASIVVDVNSGRVLQETGADSLRHPASLTKIMTLYLLFERLETGKIKLGTIMTASAHASAQAPTKLGLKPGAPLKVEDAIRALVTKSANDAAVVIAETLAGDEDDFAELMTKKARALGMSKTV